MTLSPKATIPPQTKLILMKKIPDPHSTRKVNLTAYTVAYSDLTHEAIEDPPSIQKK